MNRFNVLLATLVLSSIVGCSYINGKGDAEKFAKEYIANNFADAHAATYNCQGRDTDGNDYVSCSISVQWEESDPRREVIPFECAVNRTGNGCSNEGCRPLAVYGRAQRSR